MRRESKHCDEATRERKDELSFGAFDLFARLKHRGRCVKNTRVRRAHGHGVAHKFKREPGRRHPREAAQYFGKRLLDDRLRQATDLALAKRDLGGHHQKRFKRSLKALLRAACTTRDQRNLSVVAG